MLRIVDLPHPEWPMTQATSPSLDAEPQVLEHGQLAAPNGSGNRRVRPSTLMKGLIPSPRAWKASPHAAVGAGRGLG